MSLKNDTLPQEKVGRKAGWTWEPKIKESLKTLHRPCDIERVLGISHRQLMRILKKLVLKGEVIKEGIYYRLAEKSEDVSRTFEEALLSEAVRLRERLERLTTMLHEGRAPFLRLPIHLYIEFYPSKKIPVKRPSKSL